jgi:hypothetical protein
LRQTGGMSIVANQLAKCCRRLREHWPHQTTTAR